MNQTQIQSQKLIPGKTVCRIVGFQRTKLNCLVKVNQWIEEQKAARA